ncbi:MAG: FAD-dependent oxidoreductase, partial [candidate division NC10 bacterium]
RIKGEKLLILPTTLAIGEALQLVNREMRIEGKLGLKYTFSGSVLFDRMKDLDLYTTDVPEIMNRVDAAGVAGIFG